MRWGAVGKTEEDSKLSGKHTQPMQCCLFLAIAHYFLRVQQSAPSAVTCMTEFYTGMCWLKTQSRIYVFRTNYLWSITPISYVEIQKYILQIWAKLYWLYFVKQFSLFFSLVSLRKQFRFVHYVWGIWWIRSDFTNILMLSVQGPLHYVHPGENFRSL